MTQQIDIETHLANMSNDELMAATKQAHLDLESAANDHPNSERHEECFAGMVIYAGEMAKRGLTIATTH
jgi:hypothetical protein